VAALDRDARAAERAVSGLAGRACGVAADVTAAGEVEAAVNRAEEEIGMIDVLVNAHGVFPNRALLEVTVEEWDEVFATNVRGTMLACRALARRWVERGSRGAIVNLSSGAADSPRPGGAHYAGSKAAVNVLTRTMAMELGRAGIRVNAVAPGLVLDEVVTEPSPALHPYVRMTLEATPLGRTGSPDDVAEAVVFLASERSSWTTGAILAVNGGDLSGRTRMPLTEDLT
jgi:NAD(P)-dependent dehydrogenase (short-subunit alcohol dehydrogenase family)